MSLSITYLSHATLHPSKTNPRTHFPEDKMGELLASIKEDGINTPLRVRKSPHKVGFYELIAGECRWRSVKKWEQEDRSGCARMFAQGLPCIVEDVKDEDELELQQFLDNDKRNNLVPSEEALWVQRQLAKVALFGDMPTPEGLAQRLGKTVRWVEERHEMAGLIGAAGMTDLMNKVDAGEVAIRVAVEAVKVRDLEARAEFVTRVLRGLGAHGFATPDGSPLTVTQAVELRMVEFCVALRNVSFSLSEEGIAGQPACIRCEHYVRGGSGGPDMCEKPACLKSKKNDAWRSQKEAAEAGGMIVVEGDAARAYFAAESDHVDLDSAIPVEELRANFDGRKVKTWRGVIDMKRVQVKLVRHPDRLTGHYMAKRSEIVTAANDKAVATGQTSPLEEAELTHEQERSPEHKQAVERQMREAKKIATERMGLAEVLWTDLRMQGMELEAQKPVLEALIHGMTPSAVAFLCRVHKLKPDTGEEVRALVTYYREIVTTVGDFMATTALIALAPYLHSQGSQAALVREMIGQQGWEVEVMERMGRVGR